MTTPEGLPALDFPAGEPFDIVRGESGMKILDRIRRRYVRLTPEEWVRQHLLRTLTERLGYPAGLLALEPMLETAAGPRRPDVVAFDRDHRPALIAECKAPRIALRQDVFDQVSRYNVVAGARVLVVTNGSRHYCWRVDRASGSYDFLTSLPTFTTLMDIR